MRTQRGQSMAEYLVVLGVGGSIIAGLTLLPCDQAHSDKGCIPTLLDALHNNYQAYSAALSDVQDYGHLAVAAPPDAAGGAQDDDQDDVDLGTAPPVDVGDEIATLQVQQLLDANGNVIGTVKKGRVYDANGKDIGEYNFDSATGIQTAIIDGKTTVVDLNTVIVGSDGSPAILKAFVNSSGQVVGFGYYESSSYFDAASASKTKVPTGTVAAPIRKVKIHGNNGLDSDFGYESGGYIYSLVTVLDPKNDYSVPLIADGELVEMRLSEPSTASNWNAYSSCVVRPLNWVDNELNGYSGSGNFTFDKVDASNVTTANSASVASPAKTVGFIDAPDIGVGGCNGRWIVQESKNSWTLSGPFKPVQ